MSNGVAAPPTRRASSSLEPTGDQNVSRGTEANAGKIVLVVIFQTYGYFEDKSRVQKRCYGIGRVERGGRENLC